MVAGSVLRTVRTYARRNGRFHHQERAGREVVRIPLHRRISRSALAAGRPRVLVRLSRARPERRRFQRRRARDFPGHAWRRLRAGDHGRSDRCQQLMGIEKIKLRAEDIGIYVWLKMGFLPTSEAWREMRREAFDFILLHRPLLEKDRDVTALLTQVMAGGPSMARVLNLIDTEVPSRKIPSHFTRKMMPFGKVFFLEVASPWNGVLDLRDAETVKAAGSYH